MCKKTWLKPLSLFLFLSTLPVLAHASIPGFYVLGQIGSGNTHAEATDASATSIDSKVVFTGRIAGGYQFNQNVALEMGYTLFSDVNFTNVGGVAGQNIALSENALDFVVKPLLPLSNNFNVYAKLGLAYFKADGSAVVNGKNYLDYSDSWEPAFGLGLSYDVTPNILIDLAWTRFQTVGGGNVAPSADFYSVGMAYYFG